MSFKAGTPMSFEDHEQFRRAVLKQRDIDELRRLGLPVLRPGMSHNAVAVELRRAVRRMEVRERILKAWEEEQQATRQDMDEGDPAEGAARALLAALESGGEQKQRAEQFLKTAHPRIKEKMHEIAGVNSQWKERRSNKPNGF